MTRDIRAEIFKVEEAKAMAARGEIIDLKSAYELPLILSTRRTKSAPRKHENTKGS